MSTTNMARTITRWCAVAVMAAAVVTATADGFAQSYAGLYAWALEHGLHGWKAASFPLMVDLLIAVGELGLFLLAIDAYSLQRKHFLTWFDFLLPLLIAVAGWTASLIFNVGHVKEQDFSFQATAAVPPIVSMLGLLVLLRTLHRYVSDRPSDGGPAGRPSGQDSATPGATADGSAAASGHGSFRFLSTRDGFGHAGAPAKDQQIGRGLRLVRLTQWPPGNGAHNGAQNGARNGGDADDQRPDEHAEPAVAAPAPHAYSDAGAGRVEGLVAASVGDAADSGEPMPTAHPERVDAVGGNGRSAASTLTLHLATRERLLEELHEQQGNVVAALEALRAEGLDYDEEEARRIRRSNWLPYVVFRLFAQHGGDVDRVRQALVEKEIDCDTDVLDELARSWR